MKLFFIDNQGAWPKSAELIGDLVVWPDAGKYPTFVPVAAAVHGSFDGSIVVLAGNRGIVIAFIEGAHTQPECAKELGIPSNPKVRQYRIAIDALIHRLVMWFTSGEPHDNVDALSLCTWMAANDQSRPHARVIASALTDLMENPARLEAITKNIRMQGAPDDADAFSIADGIVTSMVQAISAKDVAAAAPAPVRRAE